ncbi:GAF domain-containing protein [Candidatus Marinimicrobia bacterium MT.SAG.3]|nr:GAF domain-containing protein [Candidatus Marinimicrobia bacterium MT.SAG.3]
MFSLTKAIRISFFSTVVIISFYLATINSVRNFNWPQIHAVFSFEDDKAIIQEVSEKETFLRKGDIILAIDGSEIRSNLDLLRELWAKSLTSERIIVIERNGETLSEILYFSHRFSDTENILRVLLAALLFALGIFIFYKRMMIHSVRNLSYIFISLAYAVSVPISQRSGTDIWSILIPFWWAILFSMIPPLTLNFALRFPYKKKILKKRPYLAPLAYLPTALILPITLYTLWEGGLYKELENYPLYNTVYKLFTGYLLIYVVTAFFILFNVLRNPMQRKQKMQVLWFIYGSAIGLFPYMFLRILPKLFGYESLISWEAILVILFVVPISWAISVFAYQLFDVEIVINRSLVYFTVLSSLVILYILIIYVSSSYLGNYYDLNNRMFMTLTIVGAALLFEPARRRIQYLIDRFFYRDWYSYRKTLLQVGRQLSAISDTHSLYRELVKQLVEILYLKNAYIVEFVEEKPDNISTYRLSVAHGLTEEEIIESRSLTKGFDLDLSSPIMSRFIEKLNPIHTDQIWIFPDLPEDFRELRKDMDKIHTQMLVPIVLNNKLIGCLCLGAKRSGASFTYKDIQLLKSLQHEVCLAIKNSSLIQGLIEAERLASLGEMSAKIAHEINNPLTVIMMNAQLELEKEQDPDLQNTLNLIVKHSRHIKELTRRYMNLGKVENAQRKNLLMSDVLHSTVESLTPLGQLKHVNLIESYLKGESEVNGDFTSLEQVFRNLILNAVHATSAIPLRKIEVGIKTSSESGFSEAYVSDNGSGIPTNVIDKIFDPYFSTKKEDEGTGLGLAVVKDIIEVIHKGKVSVESEIDKGTVFKILIPTVNTA